MKIIQSKTNVGLIRENNEDFSVSISHPREEEIILLLVADGMGGKEYGEVASSFVAQSIEKWFRTSRVSLFLKVEKVEDALISLVEKANLELISRFGRNVTGTTLSLALITPNYTFTLNVGDSRIYFYRKRKFIQVSEDASDVWFYYKYGAVMKDDLRFFFHNNVITSCIGLSEEFCHIDTKVYENDYDIVLLVTDGVSDMITDSRMKKIIETSPKEEILENIIHEAVYVDQHFHIPLRLRRKAYSKYVLPFPGRDNATGVIYIKD